MRRYLQALSARTEFVVVIVGAFGVLIAASLVAAVRPAARGEMSDAYLASVLTYELTVMAVLLPFLRVRGWGLKRFGIRVSAIDTLAGFGLALANFLTFYLAYGLVASLWPQAALAMSMPGFLSKELSLSAVIAVSIVNPIFEELFVCGYVISALRERDPWLGINVSVAIRLAYHLYQGALATISIVPSGLILGIWYARTGRLWPVIVAHALWDFLPLVHYVR